VFREVTGQDIRRMPRPYVLVMSSDIRFFASPIDRDSSGAMQKFLQHTPWRAVLRIEKGDVAKFACGCTPKQVCHGHQALRTLNGPTGD
jgi:hypothetical protein